jgi:hypothetical protein
VKRCQIYPKAKASIPGIGLALSVICEKQTIPYACYREIEHVRSKPGVSKKRQLPEKIQAATNVECIDFMAETLANAVGGFRCYEKV